jgi:hypothetical protein
MNDGAEKNEPSASNASSDSRTADKSLPRVVFPDEEGPGSVGVELSWIKSCIRDLDNDKAVPREDRDLLRLYYTREREKLQLKLHVFGEAEKIKAIESALQQTRQELDFARSEDGRREARKGENAEEDEIRKAELRHVLAEESLVKARSALQEVSSALEHLCREDTKWEKQKPSARKWELSRNWQAITPDELQPAVEAIRHKVECYGFWQSNQSTMKLCYVALHPVPAMNSDRVDAESLAPYKRFLVALLGRRIESMFLGADRPAPVIFKSYLDVLEAAMKIVIRGAFQEMFEIAKARNDVLGMHPVEWAKRQLDILVSAGKSGIRIWIKQVCDPLDYSNVASSNDSIFWGSWRAPRLIHMTPAGNTFYEKAAEWKREELVRSEEFLEGLAEHVIVYLKIYLDEVVREAHIEFAKQGSTRELAKKKEEMPVVPKPETQHRPVRAVTQAPPPPVDVLRGSGYVPRDPEPSQPLLDFPPYYPNHLQPRTSVVIGEAVKKFPVQTQVLNLLRFVISGLTPDFSAAVGEKTLRADLALGAMGDLIHSLSVYNTAKHSDTFRLEQEARKSDEWLEFARQIAAGGSVTDGKPEETAAAGQKTGGTAQSNISGATTWDAIEIQFISDERVQVRKSETTQTYNYTEFGFEDSRNGKPNRAWVLLRTLAEKRGIVQSPAEAGQNWPRVEKRIQEIRKVLRARFGISADPIPFIEGTGYQAIFKIGCRRSYES